MPGGFDKINSMFTNRIVNFMSPENKKMKKHLTGCSVKFSKRALIVKTFLFSILFIFSVSCSPQEANTNTKNTPAVKKESPVTVQIENSKVGYLKNGSVGVNTGFAYRGSLFEKTLASRKHNAKDILFIALTNLTSTSPANYAKSLDYPTMTEDGTVKGNAAGRINEDEFALVLLLRTPLLKLAAGEYKQSFITTSYISSCKG